MCLVSESESVDCLRLLAINPLPLAIDESKSGQARRQDTAPRKIAYQVPRRVFSPSKLPRLDGNHTFPVARKMVDFATRFHVHGLRFFVQCFVRYCRGLSFDLSDFSKENKKPLVIYCRQLVQPNLWSLLEYRVLLINLTPSQARSPFFPSLFPRLHSSRSHFSWEPEHCIQSPSSRFA